MFYPRSLFSGEVRDELPDGVFSSSLSSMKNQKGVTLILFNIWVSSYMIYVFIS